MPAAKDEIGPLTAKDHARLLDRLATLEDANRILREREVLLIAVADASIEVVVRLPKPTTESIRDLVQAVRAWNSSRPKQDTPPDVAVVDVSLKADKISF